MQQFTNMNVETQMPHSSILITGGSGLLGRALSRALLNSGHEVVWLTRALNEGLEGALGSAVKQIQWDPTGNSPLNPEHLLGHQAIVHLAGANVGQRWTREVREDILASRISSTRTLMAALADMRPEERPEAFIAGSAVGWYGSGDAPQDETAPHGDGFLADVVVKWENEAAQAVALGLRTAWVRTGLVLSAEGGMLGRLLPIYKLGLGSPIGNGQHWQSWIHIDDWVKSIMHLIDCPSAQGIYNAVAPTGAAVRQAELSRVLAQTLGKPHVLPNVPQWALQCVFGEMSQTILSSQHIVPSALEGDGFEWDHPSLASALGDLLPS